MVANSPTRMAYTTGLAKRQRAIRCCVSKLLTSIMAKSFRLYPRCAGYSITSLKSAPRRRKGALMPEPINFTVRIITGRNDGGYIRVSEQPDGQLQLIMESKTGALITTDTIP